MKLTPEEEAICDAYSKYTRYYTGKVNCHGCPLNLDRDVALCFSTVKDNSCFAEEVMRRRRYAKKMRELMKRGYE